MFGWIFGLDSKIDKKIGQINCEAPDMYYKILVQKYYGLQGAEWKYEKALRVSDFNYFNTRGTNWVVIGHYGDDFDYFSSYTYIMPSGGIEISEQEYIEATQ